MVKSLVSAGPLVASGGADDLIHLYDLKTNKDLGFLINPGQGPVSALSFFTPPTEYSPTHLLAGCADGTVSVWRTGVWESLKTLKGHRAEVTGIAIHPSGALALSTSRDGTLRLWDLVKGRATFTTKVEHEPDGVAFAPGGRRYAVQAGSVVVVRDVGSEGADRQANVAKLEHPRRVTCMSFGLGEDIIVTGAEDGALRVWVVQDAIGKEIVKISRAHSTRIKSITDLRETNGTGEKDDGKENNAAARVPRVMASASSDGVIKLWALRELVKTALGYTSKSEVPDLGGTSCMCQVETRARLTTLCAVDPVDVMVARLEGLSRARLEAQQEKKKRKRREKKKEGQEAAVENQVGKQNSAVVSKAITKQQTKAKVGPVAGTVSFLDEEDARRHSKKMRKVKLQSLRLSAQRVGSKSKGRRPPGEGKEIYD